MGLLIGIQELAGDIYDTAEGAAYDTALGGVPGYGDLWEFDGDTGAFGSNYDLTENGYRLFMFVAIVAAVWGWSR